MTVIVARRDDNFSQMLRDAGIEVVNLELVNTEVVKDLSEFENLISTLDEYDGVFFTSPVAAEVYAERVKPSVRPTLYALGPRSSAVLEPAGFVVKTVPNANNAEEMLTALGVGEFAGKKLLFIRGERSMRTIPEMLDGKADVDEVAVYRTVEIELGESVANGVRARLEKSELEWACFFSPSAVEAFEKRFGVAGVSVAAIGETTAAKAREVGLKVELIASSARNEVFARELIERVQEK